MTAADTPDATQADDGRAVDAVGRLRAAAEGIGIILVCIAGLGLLLYVPIAAAGELSDQRRHEQRYRHECVANGGTVLEPRKDRGPNYEMPHAECIGTTP